MTGAWRTINGERIENLVEFVRFTTAGGQRALHVGTDSLQRGRMTQFVTVLAILNPGKGGRAAYRREVRPRIESLRERLLREVWLSVELGLQIVPVIPKSVDLRQYTASQLNAVARELNGRPRQTLNWMTPFEAFRMSVASTD